MEFIAIIKDRLADSEGESHHDKAEAPYRKQLKQRFSVINIINVGILKAEGLRCSQKKACDQQHQPPDGQAIRYQVQYDSNRKYEKKQDKSPLIGCSKKGEAVAVKRFLVDQKPVRKIGGENEPEKQSPGSPEKNTGVRENGSAEFSFCIIEFNPDFHNAVMHVEDEELGENIIAEEFQKGYMYRDSVVRHSMVKVAN